MVTEAFKLIPEEIQLNSEIVRLNKELEDSRRER